MSNLNKPPILDKTGQAIKSKLTDILQGLQNIGSGFIPTSQKGNAGGVAELDSNGKIPSAQLPSFVDDVVEGYYDNTTDRFYEENTFETVIPPVDGKSWVDIAANKSYRWTGSVYVRVDEGVQLGETSSTAYRGDRGKTAYDHSQSDHSTVAPAFTEVSTRANILSGESFATLFGKIKKFFSDLKAVAFSGSYNDLSDKPTIPDTSDCMKKGVDYVTAGQKSGTTLGSKATAEGYNTTASGGSSHAEGQNTVASGLDSHAEGSYTTANKQDAHAEGFHTTASGGASHAEGSYTIASKLYAHAEGSQTTASGAESHAEGLSTMASGDYSHSEGLSTTASGDASHTEGSLTEAAGGHAHAEGKGTKASSHDQHVEGMYNVEDTNGTYAHIIGGGTGDNARKNIFTVDWNGVVRDGTANRLMPYKAVSEAEYAALSQAEKTNGTAYFRYEATGIMRQIQDDGSATSLTSGALPTGQTIESYLNSNLGTSAFRNLMLDGLYVRRLTQTSNMNAVQISFLYASYRIFSGILFTRYGVCVFNVGFGSNIASKVMNVTRLSGEETFAIENTGTTDTNATFRIKTGVDWNSFYIMGFMTGVDNNIYNIINCTAVHT